MDKLEQVLSKAAAAIEKLIEAHGEQGLEMLLLNARLSAIEDIMRGVLGLVFITASMLGLRTIFRRWERIENNDSEVEAATIGAVLLILGFVGLPMAASNLTDVHAWLGIFDPAVYLVHQAVGLK